MAETRFLPFGAAPVPSDGAEVERRIVGLLATLAQPGVRGLDGARVAAELDAPDIASLRLDVTGVTVQEQGLSAGSRAAVGAVDVARRDPATVRSLEISAHPATVLGVPTQVDVVASDVPFDWVVGTDDLLYVEVRPPSEAAPAVGTARIAAAHKDVVAAAEVVLAEVLREKGLTLTGLDVVLESRGPRALSVRVDARVQKAFLRAGATATASVSIDPSLVLDISDATIVGSNALVDGLLAPIRSKVSAYAHRRIDLAAQLPAGVTVSDVSIAAGEDIVVSVTLGQPTP